MGRDCRTYVKWFRDFSGGMWPTWLPGDTVSPGDVGRFDADFNFQHNETLFDYGIDIVLSGERPMPSRRYVTKGAFSIRASLDASAPIQGAKPRVSFVAQSTKNDAWLLVTEDSFEQTLVNWREALEGIKQSLLDGLWTPDLVLVLSRLRCEAGLAAHASARGQAVSSHPEVEVSGWGLPGMSAAAEFSMTNKAETAQVFRFDSPTSTPLFGRPMRIKRDLWQRLLPWRRSGPYMIIDPTGKQWKVNGIPTNLAKLEQSACAYREGKSEMPRHELEAMPIEDLFEEVGTPGSGQAPPRRPPVPDDSDSGSWDRARSRSMAGA